MTLNLNKDSFRLIIEVKQSSPTFGDFQICMLDGPIADKMLCYGMIGEAEDHAGDKKKYEFASSQDGIFRISICARRNPTTGVIEFDRMTGPNDALCFTYGILKLARDKIRTGLAGAEKVTVPEG